MLFSLHKQNSATNIFLTKKSRGFTLIELLVVMAIIVVITGVTLANYSEFGSQVILRNLSYNIALTVRQAQVFGIASKNFQGNFAEGHGIYIDLATNQTEYTLYADVDGNGIFTVHPASPQTNESIRVFTIGRGFKITKICVTSAAGIENCGVTKLDIIFKRPQTDAHIRAATGAASLNPDISYANARVVITSPNGKLSRSVIVGAAGQIFVRK